MMFRLQLVLLWLSPLLATVSTATDSCYYPKGNLSPDIPCNTTTTGHSACCGSGQSCMTSGLCFQNGLISRGSCTDPTFKDASCPQYCTDVNTNGGIPVIPRAWTTVLDIAAMGWCCDFALNNGTCSQGFEIKVQAGDIIPNATTRAGSSSTGSAATTTVTSICGDTGSGNGNNTCSSSSSNSRDVAIGAGIGLPLGIAAASLLFLWLRERRLRKKGLQNPAPEYSAAPGVHGFSEVPKVELDTPQYRGELPS